MFHSGPKAKPPAAPSRLRSVEPPSSGGFLTDPATPVPHDFGPVPMNVPRKVATPSDADGASLRSPSQVPPPSSLPLPVPNRTGLPDRLKAGVESLSGLSLDDVRVHRNSSKPAQMQAMAYAQGTHIHLGPGQERHLPHEAWHVVQQKQGRVGPTMRTAGVAINDSARLEDEASTFGSMALQAGSARLGSASVGPTETRPSDGASNRPAIAAVIQRLTNDEYFTKIGNIVEGSPQQAEFDQIRARLAELGWILKKTNRDHCYTSIERSFHQLPDWMMYDDEDYEDGEDVYPEIKESGTEAVVYYSDQADLIDLEHEFDHVRQMEQVKASEGGYVPSTWTATTTDGQGQGSVYLTDDTKHRRDVPTAFESDGVDAERRVFREFVAEATSQDIDTRAISNEQNEVLEYHAYLREFLRFSAMGVSAGKLGDIQKKIEQHQEAARRYIRDHDDEEAGARDPIVDACNALQSFGELEGRYEEERRG